MFRYILRRAIWSVPVLIAVSLITFVLMHLAPGGPWDAESSRPMSKEARNAIAEKYGWNKPLYVQYLSYMLGAVRGDLGPAYTDSRPVNRIIADDFPVSAAFGMAALCVGVITGLPFGLTSALRHNSLFDKVSTAIVTLCIAVPNFVLAIGLILVFAINLHLFTIHFERDRWQSWVLPLVLLALRVFALMARFTRTATLEVLGDDYIRTARMKGLRDRAITFRHILRNALLPVVTLLGPLAADLMTGSFVIESMFSIPGLGRTFVMSITSRDYSLLMGVTLFFTVLLILFNLLVDLSYTVIDPRIAHS